MDGMTSPIIESPIALLQLPEEVLSTQQQQLKQLSDAEEQACAILQLPSELRNRIYELVLLDNPVVEVRKFYQTPCLLSTCRQIRTEAGSLYYGSAVFSIKAERGENHRFVFRNAWGLCILWLMTRAFQGSRMVQNVRLDMQLSAPNAHSGWMAGCWESIVLQMVRDQIRKMDLGDSICVV